MATQCVTKTTSKAAAAAATVTMADPAATIVTPRSLMDGIATTEKEFPRKFQVDLSKLVNEPIAKRVLVLVLPPQEDLAEAPLCPCLFFKNHDVMVNELAALHAEMVGSDETLDKDDFFDEAVLNILSLKYFDEDPNLNGKSPVLVLLGVNDVVLDPPSTNLMHFFHGHMELRHHAKDSPSLASQYRNASKIIKYDDGKRGAGKKKRRLEPKKMEPTRPLKKPCVTPAAQNKLSMPIPAAAAAKKSATLSVAKEQPRASEAKDLSEASKKAADVEAATKQPAKKTPSIGVEAAKEPTTPMEIETEMTVASKELEKLSNDGGLILVEAKEGLAKASTGNKTPLPLEEIRASQGGHKMAELAAPEQEKSPAQKSLLMDASQSISQESEKAPAKKPATAPDTVPPASRADEQEPQSQVAAKKPTDVVEKTAPRQEKQARDVEMEEIEATSKKTRKEMETPEAPLHSTCSELPQPGSGEMDDDRVIGLKQVVANVEQSKETIAGGPNKQVQPSTKPPKVPGRGRPAGRNSTQKKGRGGNIRKRSASPARAIAPRFLTPEERKIPTFQEVKPMLEKAGYSFIAERSTTPRFCYLSFNEKRPQANTEGYDYTQSEEEFRKRLCSQGLGDLAKHALTSEEAAKVERWVRLAVVTSLPRAQKQLRETIPDALPWTTMQNLGYDYHSSQLTGAAYNSKVSNQKELILYLTHEGLPNECKFDMVEENDLLDLQLFLAFYERNLFESSFQTRRARRPSDASTQSTAKKPRKKPAPKKVAAVSSVQPESPRPNSEFVSPEHCDKAALADCNKSPASEASTLAGVERDIYAEMDKNNDDVEKLETCLQNLERSAKATDGKGIVLGPKGSHFQENISETTVLLESMIKSRMDHKRHSMMKGQPAALFICGPPGIGKTSGISFCCQSALGGFTDPDGIWAGRDVEPVVVEVNCSQFGASGNVHGTVLQKLWDACNGDNGTLCNEASMKKMLTSNKSDTKKRLVILVLDEIDQLVNPNSDSHIPKTNGEKLIQKLSKWSAWSDNDTLRFVLIGIGNTMNGPKYRRVKQFLEPQQVITFQAYESTDLENILRERMEDASVVDPKALSFIAKKAASNNKGDARPAIELLATALKDAKDRVKNQAGVGKGLDFTRGEYIVKVRDVVKLNTDFTRLSQLIEDLSLHAKIVVCAAVELALKNDASGSEFVVTRRDLLDATRKAFYEKLGENFGFDVAEANAHISTLDDNGIAKIAMDDTIVFSHMPQELDTAVKDSLGKDDFFGY